MDSNNYSEPDFKDIRDSAITSLARSKSLLNSFQGKSQFSFIAGLVVVSIYATLEGFLKKSVEAYINYVTRHYADKIKTESKNLFFYLFEEDLKGFCSLTNTEKKPDAFMQLVNSTDKLKNKKKEVTIEKNANLKMINKTLEHSDLEKIDLTKAQEGELHKLLKFRQSVAHGDTTDINLKFDDVHKFAILVEDIIYKINDSVEKGVLPPNVL